MRRSVLCLLSLLFMATILLSSCRKDDDGRRVRETVDLIAIIDHGETASKAYIDADDYACWSNGDRVRINNDAANPYTITLNASNRNQAIISGVTVTDDGHYAGIFPASFLEGDIDLSSGAAPSATVVLPFEQNYGDTTVGGDTYQKVRAPMVGYTTDGRYLKFRNPCALLRVNISNSDATYPITLHQILVRTSGDADAWLSGKGVINGFGSTAPEIAPTSEATYTVALNIEPSNITVAANNAETKSFYVVIPPLDFSDANFTIEVRAVKNDTYYDFSRTQSSATTSHCVIPRNSISNVNINFGDANYTAASGPFLGKGTEFDPYIIANKGDLLRLRNYVRDNTADTYMGGYFNSNTKYFRQIADIDISDETTWGRTADNVNYAIGNMTRPFAANYNGGWHKVTLNISDVGTTSTPNAIGLFGRVGGGGKIEKLTVDGSISTCSRTPRIGGIAGQVAGDFTFEHCVNKISYTSINNNYQSGQCFGGVCGYIDASGYTITISNCRNLGTLTRYYGNVGGICGAVSSGTVVFSNDTNSGNISSQSTGAYDNAVGGICGYSRIDGTAFNRCLNTGGMVASTSYMGGILGSGYYGVTFTSCRNLGNMSGSGNYYGGIMGYGTVNSNYYATFTDCSNAGDISTTGNYVGGIIGSGHNTNCTLTGCSNEATISGSKGVGGLVGYAGVAIEFHNGCINSGSVTATSRNAGGLIGSAYAGVRFEGVVSNSGTITSSNNFAGGLVGGSGSFLDFKPSSSGNNVGTINGKRCVGGIAGYVSATFWLHDGISVTNSGRVKATLGSAGGIVGRVQGGIVESEATTYTLTNNNNSVSSDGFGVSGADSVGGFFGYVNGSSGVTIGGISSNHASVSGSSFIGGMIGYATNAITIQGTCSNTGSINCTTERGGGIIGNANAGFTISNATVTNSGGVSGAQRLGGIAGCTNGAVVISGGMVGNTGTVTGTGYYEGGIVGDMQGATNCTIASATNKGSVSGTLYVGGIIGAFRSTGLLTLNECINNLDANSTNCISGSSYVGGIMGAGRHISFASCHNYVPVSGTIQYIGGIIGALDNGVSTSYIDKCVNEGNVSSTRSGTVESQLGGIIGRIVPGSTSTLYISNCTNNGNVSALNATNGINGGIVGLINYSSVTVYLKNCYSKGAITGRKYTSGLVAKNNAGKIYIENCYFNGTVSSSYSYCYALGYGYSNTFWTNCYAPIGNAGAPTGFANGTQTNCGTFYNVGSNEGSFASSVTYNSTSYELLGDVLRAWQTNNATYTAWTSDNIPTLDY